MFSDSACSSGVLRPSNKVFLGPIMDPMGDLVLQYHPPVTGVLKWEIRENALGRDPEGAPRNRGAPGGALESAQGEEEHSREHSPEHSRFLGAPSRALPRALPRIFHFSTPVTGGWDCKPCGYPLYINLALDQFVAHILDRNITFSPAV